MMREEERKGEGGRVASNEGCNGSKHFIEGLRLDRGAVP